MTRRKIPAVFIRGGTSKGVFFKEADLPKDRAVRDEIFLQVIGSPDPYGRQLNGMGGGLSSVSKVVILEPSSRPGADIDYTFVQVAVDKPVADYSQTCGNLSSAVGPFAVEEGLVTCGDGEAVVRVFNTNTSKIYHARFHVRDGIAVEVGDYTMSGVSGTGALVTLDYVHPGGALTGAFLPSGQEVDTLMLPGGDMIEASLVDATSPVAFVRAADLGKTGTEAPDKLEHDTAFMVRMDAIRRAAGVRMGLGASAADVPLSTPKIAIVSAPAPYQTISGERIDLSEHDIAIRIVSMERVHKAVTGTGAMCLAAACQVPDSLPGVIVGSRAAGAEIRIASPSGTLPVAATALKDPDGVWQAEKVTVFRTQRRLMEGAVILPYS
jgi:hypothetical protein